MLRNHHIIWACIGLILWPVTAWATKNVSGPVIRDGALRLELRSGLEFDERASRDRRISQQFFVDYGLSDRMAVRALGWSSKPDGRDYQLDAYGGEIRYEIWEPDESWLNVAARLRYRHEKASSRADTVSFTLLTQTKAEDWVLTADWQASRQVGGNRNVGTSVSASAQALYRWDEQLGVGGEWFGNAGNLSRQSGYSNQQHQIGPVMKLKLDNTTALQIGYLHGFSHNASDSLVKFFIRRTF